MGNGKQIPVSRVETTELTRLLEENNSILKEILRTMQAMDEKLRKVILNTN